MAFKVGQRVKVVRSGAWLDFLVGKEGVIVGPGGAWDYAVQIPGQTHPLLTRDSFPADVWGFDSHELAPLTPPAQDEWADAKVREVTKPQYIEPVKVKERA